VVDAVAASIILEGWLNHHRQLEKE
jgi:RNase H-fold protein (predicted Holliday junction resolvase)